MRNAFSLFDSSRNLLRFIERQLSLFSSSIKLRFWKEKTKQSKGSRRFVDFLTFVVEFSSVLITVKTGIFVSLSDKQSGNGLNRFCRLRTGFGVTVESVLSKRLTKLSECESWREREKIFEFCVVLMIVENEPMMIEIWFALSDTNRVLELSWFDLIRWKFVVLLDATKLVEPER